MITLTFARLSVFVCVCLYGVSHQKSAPGFYLDDKQNRRDLSVAEQIENRAGEGDGWKDVLKCVMQILSKKQQPETECREAQIFNKPWRGKSNGKNKESKSSSIYLLEFVRVGNTLAYDAVVKVQ